MRKCYLHAIFRAMPERRYSDDEIAAILKLAAERQELPSATGETAVGAGSASESGMTLAEVQSIAREVGIPAALVAQAATSLDKVGRPAVRRYLGLPIGVGRTVSLRRTLTQQEWERLVVDLRQTFDARGRVREEGTFRQWTNGNLQALVEPTASGQQVRLRTLNGSAFTLINGGLAMMGMGAFFTVANAFSLMHGAPGALFAGVGAVFIALGAIRLPRWARERQRQMESIATRLTDDPPALPDKV
jgi:hypothetical protein